VGLAIVARIVQKHGGKVWGESHPGTETAFYFNLPNKKEDE
jgi:signal transduction histidine kinase